MTTRNRKLALWIIAAVAVGAAGFLIGRDLRAAETPAFAFETDASSYEAPKSLAGRSLGGFSGIDELSGNEGRVVLGGRVVEKTANSVTIETAWGATTTIRITGGQGPLRRLEAADRDALQRGATVLVRVGPGGQDAAGIFVLAPP